MKAILFLCGVLLARAAADPQHCTSAAYGSLDGTPVDLPMLKLRPGVWDWHITIPSEPCPDDAATTVGSVVKVCDPDGPPPPEVRLSSPTAAAVVRRTSAARSAVVACTVYCGYPRRAAGQARGGLRGAHRPIVTDPQLLA